MSVKKNKSSLKRLTAAALLAVISLLAMTKTAAAMTISVDIGKSDIKQFQVLKDDFRYTRITGNKLGKLPETEVTLSITNDGSVIPVKRGLRKTRNQYWDILFEPGRWTMEDGKVSLMLPIALVEKDANCTHQGSMVISGNQAAYQIAAETCSYFQFNAQGIASVTITSQEDTDSANVHSTYLDELEGRLKSVSIKTINSDLPDKESVKNGESLFCSSECSSKNGI